MTRRTKPDGLSSTCRTCFNQRVNATRDEKRVLKRSRLAGAPQGRKHAADGPAHPVGASAPHLASATDAVKRRRRAVGISASEDTSMPPGPLDCSFPAQHLAALTSGLGVGGKLRDAMQRDAMPFAATPAGTLYGRQLCPTCREVLPAAHFPPRPQPGDTACQCVDCDVRTRLRQQLGGQNPFAVADAAQLRAMQLRPSSAGLLRPDACAMLMCGIGAVTSQPQGWPCSDASRRPASAGGSYDHAWAPQATSASKLPRPAAYPLPTLRCPQCQRVMPVAVVGDRQGARHGLCSLCQLAVQLVETGPPLRSGALPAPAVRRMPCTGYQLSKSVASQPSREQPVLGSSAADEATWSAAAFRHGCGSLVQGFALAQWYFTAVDSLLVLARSADACLRF